MDINDVFCLGKTVKTHGLSGEISCFIDADEPLIYSNIEAVFVRHKQNLIPYIIECIHINEKGFCIIKFKNIDNYAQAKVLCKKELYLPLDLLPPRTGNSFYFHEIIGFCVEDINYGYVGKINSVIENALQPLFAIDFDNKEVLIPIHDDFIVEVNRKDKKIIVNTPPGLIEIYL